MIQKDQVFIVNVVVTRPLGSVLIISLYYREKDCIDR
jgi:hypothetical protein